MELLINNKAISRFVVFSTFAVICFFLFFPFLTTIAVAGIFALVLNPLISRIQSFRMRKFSITCRKKCSALLLVALMVAFFIPVGMVGSDLYGRAREFSSTDVAKQKFVLKFSGYVGQLETEISNYIGKMGLSSRVSLNDISAGMTAKVANVIFELIADVLKHLPGLFIDLFVLIGALFYFLSESEKLEKFMQKLGLFSRREIMILRDSLTINSHTAVVSTIMAGLIHGCIVALGSQIVGVGDVYVIFILTFFLSFIPVVGAALVALGLCAPAIVAQNYSGALVLLGIALFASAIDNLIRPLFLVYGNNLVHPFVSLLSVLGGIALFGMSGLFIGPVLVQVTFDVLPKLARLDFSRSGNDLIQETGQQIAIDDRIDDRINEEEPNV